MIRNAKQRLAKDSRYIGFIIHFRFSDFFAVDMMMDSNLKIWVTECNSNFDLVGTASRIRRNSKLVKDLIEITYAYLRSKY
jgi:tubulin polyglutamylase TTLL1